jgi:hypothetical protein
MTNSPLRRSSSSLLVPLVLLILWLVPRPGLAQEAGRTGAYEWITFGGGPWNDRMNRS